MSTPPTPPAFGATVFDCPYCYTRTSQEWSLLALAEGRGGVAKESATAATFDAYVRQFGGDPHKNVMSVRELVLGGFPATARVGGSLSFSSEALVNGTLSRCFACKRCAIWLDGKMIWPRQSAAPHPHADLPEELLGDYREAAAILDDSPRGAAALLRLVVEKLCAGLAGDRHTKIYDDIQLLVDEGLIDQSVQMMMDSVRVVGNDAVHALEMDLGDDRSVVLRLFTLINYIVDKAISQPAMVKAFFEGLPEEQRKGMEGRALKAQTKKKPAP